MGPFNQSLRGRSSNYILKGPATWLQWAGKTSLAPVLSMGAWQAKSSCTSLQPANQAHSYAFQPWQHVLKPSTTSHNTCLRQRLPKPGQSEALRKKNGSTDCSRLFPAPTSSHPALSRSWLPYLDQQSLAP